MERQTAFEKMARFVLRPFAPMLGVSELERIFGALELETIQELDHIRTNLPLDSRRNWVHLVGVQHDLDVTFLSH